MNPNTNKKRVKRPDYLLMIVSLLVIISVLIFVSDLLKERPYKTNYIELNGVVSESISNDYLVIKSFNFKAAESGNLTLVQVTGEFVESYRGINKDRNGNYVFLYEATMELSNATALKNALDGYTSARKFDKVTGITLRSNFNVWSLIANIVPFILIGFVVFFIFKNATSQNTKAFDFAKNRAKLNREKSVTFADVAGADEEKEELAEIIDFLKTPKKYVDMGAKIPKGVLLVGSPGTGKTLLAKAVAGEASVPFFSISGSDFVEMFVGVGASRVRDLFKVAKENSPCIIFIDEIDAVGRQRGAGLGGGHDEREQTLNQLLVEMDGFSGNSGIIIIAATNRPDVLDPALLRPGRFDRQITIDLPDVRGREAILKVHARNKKLDSSIKFNLLAQRIPGFSGADIANLLNEAALLAARDNRSLIVEKDLDEAMDRVRMGPAKKSRKYTEQERRVVAYHEAGHAVIGIKLEHANVVQKITIIPRGRAGGYNLMVPAEETYLQTKQSLLDTITGYLGGRVAEEVEFNSITTGAYGDFQVATRIARAMVTEYGMSDLGPVQYEGREGNVFLGRDYFKEKNFSDQVALEIDKAVRDIIHGCLESAREIISANKDLLDKIAHYLLLVETVNKQDIDEIVETGKLAWADAQETETQEQQESEVTSTPNEA